MRGGPPRRFVTCAMILGLSFAGGPTVRAESSLTLPTPRSHYETFTPEISGLPLLQHLVRKSRSADSENVADVHCVIPFAESWIDG